MSRLTAAVTWLYARLLRLYPRAYRAAFGDELLAVFALKVRDAQAHGPLAVVGVLLAELRDLPGIVARLRRRRGAEPTPRPSRAERWGAMAFFLALALLLSLAGLFAALPALRPTPGMAPWLTLGISGAWVLTCIAAVLRGLPRWSLPITGSALGVGAMFLNGGATIAGIPLRWRIPYPAWVDFRGHIWLALVALLALLLGLAAALPWLRPLYRRFRRDWTQPSFVLYGFTPFALFWMLEESRYETPVTIAGLLILAGGAWVYMGGPTTARRMLALAGAATLALTSAALGAWLPPPLREWPMRFTAWHAFCESLGYWAWVMGVLLAPMLLGLLPHPGPAATPPAAPAPGAAGSPRATDERPGAPESWLPALLALIALGRLQELRQGSPELASSGEPPAGGAGAAA